LPGFQNIFNWSIPFISEKSKKSINSWLVSEMLCHIIKSEEQKGETSQADSQDENYCKITIFYNFH
jgi:hypothetical protein